MYMYMYMYVPCTLTDLPLHEGPLPATVALHLKCLHIILAALVGKELPSKEKYMYMMKSLNHNSPRL